MEYSMRLQIKFFAYAFKKFANYKYNKIKVLKNID